MADVFDKEKRSDIMRQVKSKKNKSTELRLIEIFKQNGITGWRRNYPVKGHPDFVFPKQKIAVFVDGCFWHGHDCRNTRPADHQEYWQKKRERNIKHDQEVTTMLEARSWKVLRIWECELKLKNRKQLIEKIQNHLQIVLFQGRNINNQRRGAKSYQIGRTICVQNLIISHGSILSYKFVLFFCQPKGADSVFTNHCLPP